MWTNEDEPATSATHEEVGRLLESGELTRGLRRAGRLVNWLLATGALALVVAAVVWWARP